MKKFTVPIFLGVSAESAKEAQQKALNFMEYALDTGNDKEEFPYCDVGAVKEVIEQKEN